MISISEPFIRRPVGTTLLSIGLFLLGFVAYAFLPVAPVPNVDFPSIRVQATRPGADPSVMAATVAAPLERKLGQIAGIDQITSTSSLGTTNIQLTFSIGRDIDRAARDVQAAINASLSDLPSDLPTLPKFRKFNSAAAPVFVLALTSKTLTTGAIYDVADTVIAQRIAQVPGVGDATVSGADQPAVRVSLNPVALSNAGIATDDVRLALVNANPLGPVGIFNGSRQSETLALNKQMRTAEEYRNIMIKSAGGNFVRLSDVADVEDSVRNSRSIAWFNKQPAVLIQITKQGDANVIETVDRVKALIPDLKQWIPAGVEISTLVDRTTTIRASVQDMQWTLLATAVLVMIVVFVFLRRLIPTVAAGISVPLALAGTCAGMWLAGFSIDNLSLMALAISVGFVVDDAIVMIENMYRNLEHGMAPLRAAMDGARQIGFTVVSISLSLIAAFTPLIFMDGIVGRLLARVLADPDLRHRGVDRGVADDYADDLRALHQGGDVGSRDLARPGHRGLAVAHRGVLYLDAASRAALSAAHAAGVLRHHRAHGDALCQDAEGLFPDRRFRLHHRLDAGLRRHFVSVDAGPAAAYGRYRDGRSGGGRHRLGAWRRRRPGGGGSNRGIMFISLKPPEERAGITTAQVIDRLRKQIFAVPGIRLFMFAAQDVRTGGRQSDSNYQYTLSSTDLDLLQKWAPIVQKRMETIDGVTDVSADRDPGGLQLTLQIDRQMASRLGVAVQDIDNALNNAFSQRQISYIYTQRNQYVIVLEIDPKFQTDPSNLERIYVAGAGDTQVPLSAVVRYKRDLSPLAVFHSQSFPSTTVSFNVPDGVPLDTATTNIQQAVAELHMPEGIRGSFDGNAGDFGKTSSRQPLLILGALVAMYIVLGVLYESLAHPLTIISTLPSAGLGALLALQITGTPLTVIAFVGIILLIGIVKKNGIMMVDFALDAERNQGLSSEEAIFEACRARFRPILMTTMAALFAGIPLVVATGPGTELRRPLGITIIGGLFVSQILTLYTTPVIYLLIDRLRGRAAPAAAGAPAE